MKQLVCIKLFNEGLCDFLKCFSLRSWNWNWVVRTKFIKPEKRKLPLAANIKIIFFCTRVDWRVVCLYEYGCVELFQFLLYNFFTSAARNIINNFFRGTRHVCINNKILVSELEQIPDFDILASSTTGIVTLVDRIEWMLLKRRLAKYPSEILGLSFTIEELDVVFQHFGQFFISL